MTLRTTLLTLSLLACGSSDDEPGTNAWLNAYEGRRRPYSNDSGSNPPSSGLGATSSDPASHYNYNSSGYCSTPETNEVVPLTSDKSFLLNKIDGLTATGSTAGALGTAVTWYMLSPKWNSVWPSACPTSAPVVVPSSSL